MGVVRDGESNSETSNRRVWGQRPGQPVSRQITKGVIRMFEDKVLVCKDCGQEFTFTAGEQEFYAEKGFRNEPTRCRECRRTRKNGGERKTHRELFDAVCAECGKPTKIPFEPKTDKPVYCSECYNAHRKSY